MNKETLKSAITDIDLTNEEHFNKFLKTINDDANITISKRDEEIKSLHAQIKELNGLKEENQKLNNSLYITRKVPNANEEVINDTIVLAKSRVNENTTMEQAMDYYINKYYGNAPKQAEVVQPKQEEVKQVEVKEEPVSKPVQATPSANINTNFGNNAQPKTGLEGWMSKLGLGQKSGKNQSLYSKKI